MIDIMYQKKFLKINQIWYPGETAVSGLLGQKRKTDILFVHGVDKEQGKGFFRGWQEYHTCMNDLTRTEEEIFSDINKNVRYECRRSEKDGVEIRFYSRAEIEGNPMLLDTFADIYQRMYQSKGLDVDWNKVTVDKYLEEDAILFSAALYEGEIIVFHAYICDETDTRLLYSASCFRETSADQNLIGRANKRLQWEDMKYFKNKGVKRYDWGGISNFENPNGIDEFKLKFGGEKVTYYNVFAGNSLLGKAGIVAMKLMKKVH